MDNGQDNGNPYSIGLGRCAWGNRLPGCYLGISEILLVVSRKRALNLL